MPTYDYQCQSCGHQDEILQKMTDEPLTHCTHCHMPSFKRKFGMGIGLQFQGSGFYCTDYSKPSSPATEKSASKSNCGCGKTACS